jgi:hypothetical protein
VTASRSGEPRLVSLLHKRPGSARAFRSCFEIQLVYWQNKHQIMGTFLIPVRHVRPRGGQYQSIHRSLPKFGTSRFATATACFSLRAEKSLHFLCQSFTVNSNPFNYLRNLSQEHRGGTRTPGETTVRKTKRPSRLQPGRPAYSTLACDRHFGLRATLPSFITKFTPRSASMFSSGFAGIAMMSAA